MKKARLLAPRNQAREVLSDDDAERMLASGSWVLATVPKKPNKHLIAQNQYAKRRREAGFRKLEVLLPGHVYDDLNAIRLEGESMAQLLERLLSEVDNSEKSISDTLEYEFAESKAGGPNGSE